MTGGGRTTGGDSVDSRPMFFDRENRAEFNKLRWGLAAVALFIGSGYLSYREARYAAFSETTAGVVAETHEGTERRGRFGSHEVLVVTYIFTTADGEQRSGETKVDLDDAGRYEVGTPVQVEYIPGSKEWNRLEGTAMVWMVIPFVAMLGVMAFFGVKFCREFNEHKRLDEERNKRYSTVR